MILLWCHKGNIFEINVFVTFKKINGDVPVWFSFLIWTVTPLVIWTVVQIINIIQWNPCIWKLNIHVYIKNLFIIPQFLNWKRGTTILQETKVYINFIISNILENWNINEQIMLPTKWCFYISMHYIYTHAHAHSFWHILRY